MESVLEQQFQVKNNSTLKEWFGDNHFLVAGFILMFAGVAANALFHHARALWAYLMSEMFVTVDVPSTDDSFNYVVAWISNPKHGRRSTTKNVQTKTIHDYTDDDGNPLEWVRPKILFTPAEGSHVFEYKGKWLWITRAKCSNAEVIVRANSLMEKETIRIAACTRDRGLIEELIRDAMNVYYKKDDGRTVMFTSPNGHFWNRIGSRPSRPLSSVILDAEVMGRLLADARRFRAARSWYRSRGVPYRRGYLLHGPPGTGKTSAILALAGELGMSISTMSLSAFAMDDDGINHLMNQAQPNTIILMEDVDAAFVSRSEGTQANRLSFSGFLNAIDGVFSQEGRLLFMTTNHAERLDPALLRPGRVDVQLKIDYASRDQARRMFRTMYYDRDRSRADEFAQSIPERAVSPAQLQGYFMEHKDDPDAAVEHADELRALVGQNHVM